MDNQQLKQGQVDFTKCVPQTRTGQMPIAEQIPLMVLSNWSYTPWNSPGTEASENRSVWDKENMAMLSRNLQRSCGVVCDSHPAWNWDNHSRHSWNENRNHLSSMFNKYCPIKASMYSHDWKIPDKSRFWSCKIFHVSLRADFRGLTPSNFSFAPFFWPNFTF